MKKFWQYDPPKEKYNFKISKSSPTPTLSKDIELKCSLVENEKIMSMFLHKEKTNDAQFRNLSIVINNKKFDALLIFYDGLVDSEIINNYIIKQLITNTSIDDKQNSVLKNSNTLDLKNVIPNLILADSSVKETTSYKEIIDALLHGDTVLFIDEYNLAFICDSKKLPGRTVGKAEIEMNLQGPNEAFVENFRTNTALIRKFVKDENLIFETIEIGTESKTRCAISYISKITNDSIITEVKNRLNNISIDYLLDSGQLEQLIEDKTSIISPLILNTERPDKVASHLIEGRVAIIVEGSNNVLIVPAIFSDFIHPSEDSYVRFPYSLLLRITRIPAIFISIFLPGIYIAICNFHQELILTDLLLAIAGTRERVPFTMLLELLIMEIAFEIIREASIRTPAPVGPTLGIIGTLILGQAIVSANIVSPILIIIVALTGISTFIVSDFALNYSFRILRFVYIFLRSICRFLWALNGDFYTSCTFNNYYIFWRSIFNTFRST